MKTEYFTFCDTGKRKCNEDYVRVVEMPEQCRTLFVLCDGMGGHAMGEYASKTVGDIFADYWQNNPDVPDSDEKVSAACHLASNAFDKKSAELGRVEMGTTLVMASIESNKVTIAHIGDSRCYLLRKGKNAIHVIYQTEDHVDPKYGGERVSKCFFTNRPDVAIPDIRSFELTSGDVLFLCSDGVCKYVRPDILQARLMDERTPAQIADVIEFLCEKNSEDNYSGIVIQVKGEV